jgi:hypothetical protein
MYCFIGSEAYAVVNVRFGHRVRKLCVSAGDVRDDVEMNRQAYVGIILRIAGKLVS